MSTRTNITITFEVKDLSEGQIRELLAEICTVEANVPTLPTEVNAFDFATLASSGSLECIEWTIVDEEWKTIKE